MNDKLSLNCSGIERQEGRGVQRGGGGGGGTAEREGVFICVDKRAGEGGVHV